MSLSQHVRLARVLALAVPALLLGGAYLCFEGAEKVLEWFGVSHGHADDGPRDERKLGRHVTAEVGRFLDGLARQGFDRVVGTSGTIQSLGAIATGHDQLRQQ